MLAGQTLTFNAEVVAVRAATEEEIAHGHIHQGGGCCGGGSCGDDHGHDHDHKEEGGCCGGEEKGGCGCSH